MDIEKVARTVQVVSVVAGVVISIMSFNATRQKDIESRERESVTRKMEAERESATRRMEAAKPFLQLRQNLYREALKCAAILSTPEHRKQADLDAARRRFRELYVAELSMVEDPNVEKTMVALAEKLDPQLLTLTGAQQAAYDLAHALRDAFVTQWGVTDVPVAASSNYFPSQK